LLSIADETDDVAAADGRRLTGGVLIPKGVTALNEPGVLFCRAVGLYQKVLSAPDVLQHLLPRCPFASQCWLGFGRALVEAERSRAGNWNDGAACSRKLNCSPMALSSRK
jgi:hypothetical protein